MVQNDYAIMDMLDGIREKLMIERNQEIIRLRADGWTLQAIGDKYGLTRERIRQILENQKADKTQV